MSKLAATASAALLTLALTLLPAAASAFSHEISQAELQDKVAAAMPLEIKKRFYKLVISDPEIDLGGGDGRVAVVARLGLTTGSGQANGVVSFTGVPTYDPATASLFLSGVVIRDLRVDGAPESHLPGIRVIAQLAASHAFARHPIHVIRGDSLKSGMAKAFLKSVAVEDNKLILLLEVF